MKRNTLENANLLAQKGNLNDPLEIQPKSSRFEFDNNYEISGMEKKKSNLNMGDKKLDKSIYNEKSLPYSLFENIVLEFQLESHSKYIRKYSKLFRMYDLNNQGYISIENFKNMLKSMKIKDFCDKNIENENILFKDSPLPKNQITFSESVLILLMEQIPIKDKEGNRTQIEAKRNSYSKESNEKSLKEIYKQQRYLSIMDIFLNS